MYSTIGILKNSKLSGKIVGTHQKLDTVARGVLGRHLPRKVDFPSAKEILHFEGSRGPDGIKRKSPGEDEPMHFIIPDHDDGKLIGMILDHRYNLRAALKAGNRERAAFEAAWMAHAITDGLTPAHHFPLLETQKELMTNEEFVKVFGEPIKGIMHGDNLLQATRNNWLYWGVDGHMSTHVAFEFGVAMVATPMKKSTMTPNLARKDFHGVDARAEFYADLDEVARLHMYDRFRKEGWTTQLAMETRNVLLPTVVRAIALEWASAIPELDK